MRISVTMATYNGSAWLAPQLQSLARQSRPPDEVVVFDDCSSDQTVQIIRDFAARVSFPVRVEVNSQNKGATKNFEAVIAAADGDVICPCDQDDVWYPDKLQRIENEFRRDEQLDLVFTDGDVVDQSLRPLGYTVWESIPFTLDRQSRARRAGLLRTLVRFNVVTGAAMAFKSKWRSMLLPIPETWVHDGWIALILSAFGKCHWIPGPTIAYRQHSRQQIGAPRLSFSRQLAVAKKMDRAYFNRQAEMFSAALVRMKSLPVAVPAANVDLLAAKVAHCRHRTTIRTRSEGWITSVLREYLEGGYSSYSFGWKSVAQDLVLV
jgi:glycosyltransferase involved in cell wall biosynthesis